MAEIIDLLTPDNDVLPNFTVNTGVNSVMVTGIGGTGAKLKACNGAFSKFQRGDCFTILSVGIFIPERFVIWDYPDAAATKYSSPIFALWGTVGAGSTPIMSFGNNGEFKIPFPNYEFSIGVFNDPEAAGLTDPTFELVAWFPTNVNTMEISMIDVPAALHGLTFNIVPFVKVLHNFALTS